MNSILTSYRNALQRYGSCWKNSHKNIPPQLDFLERTNCACIVDGFRRVINTLSVNSAQFVESRAKLLNAYNEPGIKSLILFPLQVHRSL